MASELSNRLDSADIELPIERLRVATSFVRNMEYATDESATGEVEYPKFVTETLMENGGDCEDLSSVLAGILCSPPFDYEPVLIFFSGHVGIGLDPSNIHMPTEQFLTVGGQEYFYIDASHDIPLGVVPDEYQKPGVIATYDGQWQTIDPAALKEHATTTIANDTNLDIRDYI
ncbi:hypothetical protein C454_18309 [Haloferax gibbonsii ATCC 33959]|uniref:Transglutaminase-like domain-containing protein n=2 Tax=Haloferax gibbonsii TaxID=35746 RepID=M0GXP1_HALGM|nr:hypothetical protein C454_18309 [Haloferax gibbonsii ATCC 33959]